MEFISLAHKFSGLLFSCFRSLSAYFLVLFPNGYVIDGKINEEFL
jgi:hypothetical protein